MFPARTVTGKTRQQSRSATFKRVISVRIIRAWGVGRAPMGLARARMDIQEAIARSQRPALVAWWIQTWHVAPQGWWMSMGRAALQVHAWMPTGIAVRRNWMYAVSAAEMGCS